MSELVVGKIFHIVNAFAVKELEVVHCGAVQEVIRTYSEPEEVEAVVEFIGIVVYWQVGGGE